MIGAWRSAWLILRRPVILWPSLAALVVFSVTSIVFTFSTAAAPGGSRLTDPPTTLADLTGADTPAQLVGRPIMILGTIVLAIAVLHLAGQYSSGFVRVALVLQPRRTVWLLGNWLALAAAAAIGSVIAAASAMVAALVCSRIWNVDTSAWADGAGAALIAALNLVVGMIAFAVAGSALAVWLRSSTIALAVGLVYALFENMVNAVAPVGQGLLPVAAFTTVATSGFLGTPYLPSLVATVAFLAAIVGGTLGLVRARNVTD